MKRILVTGSRTWTDVEKIRKKLLEHTMDTPDVIIVHGDCPKGADAIADQVAYEQNWIIERHPADWKKKGKRAGYVRNAEMVRLGADICLAFIRDESSGASMCANLAEKAGIPTTKIV